MTAPTHASDFDTLAVEYHRFRSSYSDRLFDTIARYAGSLQGRRALDIACGTGLSTRGLTSRGIQTTGIDIAATMLDAARQAGLTGATFFEARAESLPFADGAFGLVTCGQAFHWFEARVVLDEIERVLVRGGAHAQYWKHALPSDPYVKAADDLEREWLGLDSEFVWNAYASTLRDAWTQSRLVDREKHEF